MLETGVCGSPGLADPSATFRIGLWFLLGLDLALKLRDAYTEDRDASVSTHSDQNAAVASHLSNESASFRKLSARQSGRDPDSGSVSGI